MVVLSGSDLELCKPRAKQLCNCFSNKDCEGIKILTGFSARAGMHWFWMVTDSRGGNGKINVMHPCKKVEKATVAQYLKVKLKDELT